MSRRTGISLAAGAAILVAAAFGVGPSLAAKATRADLSGSWQLDRSKSDLPGGPGGPGGFRRGGNMGGERLRSDGSGSQERGGPEGRQGRFGRRLPDFLHVTEQGGVISFTDSTGTVFQEIRTPEATPDASATNPNDEVRRLTGHWDGGTLVAEMQGPRGGTVVQKYSLEEHGKELDVRIERKGGSGGGGRFAGREFKLVYRRAT
jgi:hypothetical protein